MANNVKYNEPVAGRVFAADEINSTLYQWSKLDVGPPGSSIPLTGTVQFGAAVDVTRIQSGSVTSLGNSNRIKGTVTVSGAYTVGNLLGSMIVLSGATRITNGRGVIETVVVSDNKLTTGVGLSVVFFEANPSSTTFTDRAALTVNSADLINIVGHVSVAAVDYVNFATNCVATKTGLGFEFNSVDTNLYMALVSNGTPTYLSSSNLQATVSILQVS